MNPLKFVRKILFPKVPEVIILGNQKSGTSAIVELLGKASECSYQNDIEEICEPVQSKLHNKQLRFKDFANNMAANSFSKNIVKEPGLTFLFTDVIKLYPKSKYVFIVRDPRDNIRSILDRVKLKGDIQNISLDDLYIENESWRRIIDNRWLGYHGDDYIESLSYRWNLCINLYRKQPERFVLVRYEDFVIDKAAYIYDLCRKLSLPYAHNIQHKVDVQYQPKGNSNVTWPDFFGKTNLDKINQLCEENMKLCDYKL